MKAVNLYNKDGKPLLVDNGGQAISSAAFSSIHKTSMFRAGFEFNFGVAGAIRFSLENPAGSGKLLVIRGAHYYASLLTGVIAVTLNFRLGATAGLPTTVRPIYPVRLGGTETTIGVMKADFDQSAPPTEPSGGFLAGKISLREEVELLYTDIPLFILAPGTMMTVGGNFESSTRATIEFIYSERDEL